MSCRLYFWYFVYGWMFCFFWEREDSLKMMYSEFGVNWAKNVGGVLLIFLIAFQKKKKKKKLKSAIPPTRLFAPKASWDRTDLCTKFGSFPCLLDDHLEKKFSS